MKDKLLVAKIYFDPEGKSNYEIADFEIPEGFSNEADPNYDKQSDKESFVLTCLILSLLQYLSEITPSPFETIKMLSHLYDQSMEIAIDYAKENLVHSVIGGLLDQFEKLSEEHKAKEETDEADS